MNRLEASIISVQTSEGVSFVELDLSGDTLICLTIDSPDYNPSLKQGTGVVVCVEESAVCVVKGLVGGLGIRNRLECRVAGIEMGEILTYVALDYRGREISAITTTWTAREMALSAGDAVTALMRPNELTLEFLDGTPPPGAVRDVTLSKNPPRARS